LLFWQRQPNATKRAQTNGAIPRASLNFNLKLVHNLRIIYTNCHSAGNYLKVSATVINQALPFYACNYFRALYQLYLLNSPKLFNKFTMVNADTTLN
jgi:hypothetical protein